jgi:hypothetical protein
MARKRLKLEEKGRAVHGGRIPTPLYRGAEDRGESEKSDCMPPEEALRE